MPTYTVTAKIAAGALSYEDEDSLKPAIIPIFDGLDKVSLVAPLRQAKAEKDKAAKAEGKTPADVVTEDELAEVRISLDLGVAKDGLDLASTKLKKDDLQGIEQALAAVMGSLHFNLHDEMKSQQEKLEAGKENEGFTATIEGWWDRIGKLMK